MTSTKHINKSNVDSKSSRKIRKPLMERRRRARINQSLDRIKEILVQVNAIPVAIDKVNCSIKFEKADILEWAIRYIESIRGQGQRHHMQTANNCNCSTSDDESNSSISSSSEFLSSEPAPADKARRASASAIEQIVLPPECSFLIPAGESGDGVYVVLLKSSLTKISSYQYLHSLIPLSTRPASVSRPNSEIKIWRPW